MMTDKVGYHLLSWLLMMHRKKVATGSLCWHPWLPDIWILAAWTTLLSPTWFHCTIRTKKNILLYVSFQVESTSVLCLTSMCSAFTFFFFFFKKRSYAFNLILSAWFRQFTFFDMPLLHSIYTSGDLDIRIKCGTCILLHDHAFYLIKIVSFCFTPQFFPCGI